MSKSCFRRPPLLFQDYAAGGPVVVEAAAEVDEQFAVDVVVDCGRRHSQRGVVQRQLEVAAQRRSVQQPHQQTLGRHRLYSVVYKPVEPQSSDPSAVFPGVGGSRIFLEGVTLRTRASEAREH